MSVIICCYNSSLRLPETLKYLALQKVTDPIPWEIIIVNNNSNDSTANVAALEWAGHDRHDVALKIVDQPVAGLSFAREKGLAEAKFDYLVFCDDDNWLNENYIENAYKLLEDWQSVAIIGAFGIPRPQTDPPYWFKSFSGHYATGAQNKQAGKIDGESPYVYGAGAVVRKSVLKQLETINFKPLATDRLYKKLSSGGDVELCYAIKLLGYDIAYSDALKFFHFIPKDRLTEKYLLDLVFQMGYCNIIHRPYFWLFNPGLAKFKKTWLWTLMISLNIYRHSLFKSGKNSDAATKFKRKIDLSHAKGRLAAILKLNYSIEKDYLKLSRQFQLTGGPVR